MSLSLPPLRDRPEDFIPLAESFLERYSTRILEKVMRRSNWSQTKAAELLRLQRTYLARLLKQKGIKQGRTRHLEFTLRLALEVRHPI